MKETLVKKVGGAVIAALAVFACFGIAAAPARAEICGDIDDGCEVPFDVRDWNLDQFEAFFPLDGETCTKMTQSVLKQCEAAVKNAAKCWRAQINSIPKTAKSACKTEGDLADVCNAAFKSDAADDLEQVDYFESVELDCCITAANGVYAACLDF